MGRSVNMSAPHRVVVKRANWEMLCTLKPGGKTHKREHDVA